MFQREAFLFHYFNVIKNLESSIYEKISKTLNGDCKTGSKQAKITFFFFFVAKKTILDRSSRPEVFSQKDVLKHFSKFTGKHLCLRPATLLKKRLWHRCFPVNFKKFLSTTFLTEHLRWLLLM